MQILFSGHLLRRFAVFLFTVWFSATLIFIIPRLAPGDPITSMVARMSQNAGSVQGADQIIAAWRERFGLNDPVPVQYVRYLGNLLTFDYGYSMTSFPTEVSSMIGRALPWTIGLLTITTIVTFLLGNLVGALLAWEATPSFLRNLIPISMIFTSIPALLVAIALLSIFASALNWFPIMGAYGRGITPGLSWEFITSVIHHGILPAVSIVIVTFGYWAIGMRGMMVTVEGEDYVTLAHAKGLNPFRVLYRYMVRNAILPQVTGLALAIGTMVGGQALVEVVFSYPGMGSLIYRAIREQDYPVIQGTSFILILTTALSVLIIDLVYPLIDPRIRKREK